MVFNPGVSVARDAAAALFPIAQRESVCVGILLDG
jgi:hypothetical protein